jgi:hypothetical protein
VLDGIDTPLDEALYPKRSLEGSASVIYRDDLTIPDPNVDPPLRPLSVASYGVRWDGSSQLWYCDIAVAAGFIGWCGLALYRHQPHSHQGRELSETPAWVYGAILHGEPIAWVNRHDGVHVTIGPVYDKYTAFALDAMQYDQGVSEELAHIRNRRVSLQRYTANHQVYFEGIVARDGRRWSVIKTRFGKEVASMDLNVEA